MAGKAKDRILAKLEEMDDDAQEAFLEGWEEAEAEEVEVEVEEVEEESAAGFSDDPEPPSAEAIELRRKIEALEAKNRANELVMFSAEAGSFLDSDAVKRRIVPAAKDRLKRVLVRCATVDRDHPEPVYFDDKKRPIRSSLAADVKAAILALPEHGLTVEEIQADPTNYRALFSGAEAPDTAAAEKARDAYLMSLTSAGNGQAANN